MVISRRGKKKEKKKLRKFHMTKFADVIRSLKFIISAGAEREKI